MAENVVVRQGQERGRQDVRREQHSREHAAPGRTHLTFQYTGNWFRVQGSGFSGSGFRVRGSGFRFSVHSAALLNREPEPEP